MDTPVAQDPNPELERVPDHRNIADPRLDGVAVDPSQPAARSAAGPVDEQFAPQHRGLAGQRRVDDAHPELHGPDDRVGRALGRQGRRLRHRVPEVLMGKVQEPASSTSRGPPHRSDATPASLAATPQLHSNSGRATKTTF